MHTTVEELRTERLPQLEKLLLVLVLALGIHLRWAGMAHEPLIGDELHIREQIETSLAAVMRIRNPVEYLGYVGLGVLQRLSLVVFGPSAWSFRLPALVCGVLGLLIAYPVLRPLFGARAAWLGTAFLALHPMHVYYSRFARSYTLVVLLSLLFVGCLWKGLAAREKPWPRRWILPAALSGGLMPFFHPISMGMVIGVAPSALWLAWSARRRWRDVWVTAGVFAGAALVFALLLEPIRESFLEYTKAGKKEHANSVAGIVTLLGGSFPAGVLLVGGALAACVVLAWRRDHRAGLLSGIFAGPLVMLIATAPAGMDYTYARYLIPALPFLLGAAAWSATQGLRLLGTGSAGARIARAVPVALLALFAAAGPLWGTGLRTQTFSNGYLSLCHLAPFDVPFDQMPRFYRELEGDVTLIECPLSLGSTPLLRNYAMQHGRPTLVGVVERGSAIHERAPYVMLKDEERLRATGARYVIVHGQISREVRRYLEFVEQRFAEDPRWYEENLVGHFSDEGTVASEYLAGIAKWLTARFGEKVYTDDWISVWDLTRTGEGEPERPRRKRRG